MLVATAQRRPRAMYLATYGSGCGVLVSLAVAGILIFWLHDRCQPESQYNARGTPWTATRSTNEANPRLFFMVLNFKMISVLLIGRDWRIGYNNTGCLCIAYTTVLCNTLWLPIRKLSVCWPGNLICCHGLTRLPRICYHVKKGKVIPLPARCGPEGG